MFFRKPTHIKRLSDAELVQHYQQTDDPTCIGELYERYTHLVFLVCMKYLKDPVESEDVVMQVFEKLIKDLHKYEVRNFKYWLHTVTKNQCLVYLEKRKKQRHKIDEYRETQAAHMESEGEPYLPDEREARLVELESAISELNEHQRICVELFYLQKKSYQEVAEETGYSMKQVKSYIQNGKRNLRKHLETRFEDGTHLEQINE